MKIEEALREQEGQVGIYDIFNLVHMLPNVCTTTSVENPYIDQDVIVLYDEGSTKPWQWTKEEMAEDIIGKIEVISSLCCLVRKKNYAEKLRSQQVMAIREEKEKEV